LEYLPTSLGRTFLATADVFVQQNAANHEKLNKLVGGITKPTLVGRG